MLLVDPASGQAWANEAIAGWAKTSEAVWTGILAAGVQFVAAMFFSFNPNFWGPALAILIVDAMVIHGLSRYGLESAEV